MSEFLSHTSPTRERGDFQTPSHCKSGLVFREALQLVHITPQAPRKQPSLWAAAGGLADSSAFSSKQEKYLRPVRQE